MERPARESNLVFSDNIRDCIAKGDIVFLCVETPTKTEGEGRGFAADTRSLEKAVEEIAKWGKDGVVVVVKSTVPVGTADRVREMVSFMP